MGQDEIESYLSELEDSGANTRFARLVTICTEVFGKPKVRGSHHKYKVPWSRDPRVNLQKAKGGKAKPYQVAQVVEALEKLLGQLE